MVLEMVSEMLLRKRYMEITYKVEIVIEDEKDMSYSHILVDRPNRNADSKNFNSLDASGKV